MLFWSCLKVRDPEECERPLIPPRPACSATTGLLVLGSLLLVLCAGWLLATMFWLHNVPSDQPHKPPTPSSTNRTDAQGSKEQILSVTVPNPQACAVIAESWRFDCYPESRAVVTREMCEARGCCFIPVSSSSTSSSSSSPSGRHGIPWCFYPEGFGSYSLVSVNDTALGEEGRLVRDTKTYYPGDIMTLHLEIRHETNTRLRVRVRGAANYKLTRFFSMG